MSDTTQPGRPVLVTTAHRGVFFGYADPHEDLTEATVIALKRARNCIYWSRAMRGFLGLASAGPDQDCRIGPTVDIVLRDVTCIADVEPDAVKRWEASPWG